MSDPVVLHEDRGAVHLLTVHRPKALNALNDAVLTELGERLDALARRSDIRAIVLTGAGDQAFVAGADIAEMASFSALQAEAFSARGQALCRQIEAFACPVIAAVAGFALGGGCELAMACDIVLAGPNAKFGQPEVRLGVIPGFGGTQRLVRRVGPTRALDLCLTGRNVGADEAVAMGLAARKVDGDVVEAAMRVAAEIAGMGPVAVRLCKRAIVENADAALSTAMAAERSLFALCFSTRDQREGMAAFLAKRKPEFTGE
jgi:enoyl-CoA hydratase